MAVQETVRADALHQGVDRHDQHTALHHRQLVEGRQAGGDNILMRRKAVVGQRFPVGKVRHRQIGKLADFIQQTQSGLGIGCNH